MSFTLDSVGELCTPTPRETYARHAQEPLKARPLLGAQPVETKDLWFDSNRLHTYCSVSLHGHLL